MNYFSVSGICSYDAWRFITALFSFILYVLINNPFGGF